MRDIKIYLSGYLCLAEVLDWILSRNNYQPTSLVPRPFEEGLGTRLSINLHERNSMMEKIKAKVEMTHYSKTNSYHYLFRIIIILLQIATVI